MDLPLPLRIHIGFEQELVIRNNTLFGKLKTFELYWRENQAKPSVHAAAVDGEALHVVMPDNALSNQAFPLRIYLDDQGESNELRVWLLSRPLARVKSVYVALTSDPDIKRIVRLVFHQPLVDEVLSYLIELGVEVVTDEPDFEGVEEQTYGPTEVP